MNSEERFLTVREALSRPAFRSARIAAGESGLGRQIRWVHILETPDFETLIHGEEMILTTGMAFKLESRSSVAFLESLIKQNASCLCIELGQYVDAVPDELRDLADAHQFPLIVFPSTVRFVDITQDLHSLLINRHHLVLEELESISREFSRLALTSQATAGVLRLLQKSMQSQIIYRPLQGKPLFFPNPAPEGQADLLSQLGSFWEETDELKLSGSPYLRETDDATWIIKPVGALEQTWAYLIAICRHQPREFDYLLLDSASLSIAQELLRTRYMEERKQFAENIWVDELLSGRADDDQQLKTLIGPDFKSLNELHFRVCVIEIENLYELDAVSSENELETIRFHLSLLLRSAFEKFSFRPLITLKNNRLAVIALDRKAKTPNKVRLRQALESLQALQADDKLKELKLLVGVGKQHLHLRHAYSGYQEAIQALSLYACYKKTILFYEELGVFQLLLNLNDGKTLQTFIRNYLGPLIDYDEARGSELLTTLRIYLDHDGSKQIAAQKLFIVRQSLYYRLEKIAELLGDDFMLPENRISIQVALRAYQLLHPDKFEEKRSAADG